MNEKSRNSLFVFLILLMISVLILSVLFLPHLAPTESSTEDRLPKAVAESPLPKLLDFGAGTCIPCKKMAPILKELSEEYEGRVIIRIIEVYDEKELTKANGIQVIPTQIFFDSKNQRVFRHQGFMDKEQIKEIFDNMGIK